MAVACLSVQQVRAELEPSVAHYLESDRNHNVIQRLRTESMQSHNLMSDEDKAPVRVFLFEASAKQLGAEYYLSQFIAPDDLASVQQENGKFLIPCLATDKIALALFKLKFGKPVLESTAHKVLSRATYYIEPVGSLVGFFAKFTPHAPGLDQKIEREVLVNDYIQTQLHELPPELRNLTMNSFMSINLSVFGIPISIGYRSAARIRNKPENILVYPGHGLLGCEECVEKYAKKWSGDFDSNKAVAQWKTQELLPKLAKYMALSHHTLGVSFEAHTQNMVIDIDKNTGEIKAIYFRDFADVLLNPIVLIADNRFPEKLDWKRVKLVSMHPNYFSDQSTAVARDIWYHASIYSGQGITSHIEGFPRQQKYMLEFLQLYLKESEKILGEKIELSQDAKDVLERLANQTIRKDSGELQERSHLRNAMASVLKPIIEDIHQKKTAQLEEQLRSAVANADQEMAKKIFYKAMTRQKIVYMGQGERQQILGEDTKNTWLRSTIAAYLGFGFGKKQGLTSTEIRLHNGRLFAMDIETGKPLGMMVDMYQEPKSWLNKILPKQVKPSAQGGGSCHSAHRGHL